MQTNNKLRKALKDIGRLVEQIHFLYSDYPSEIHEIARKVNAALAEPVRNYEIGTAEEQAARMRAFCAKNGLCRDGSYRCENCGLLHEFRCELTWAQMPYEEGDAK